MNCTVATDLCNRVQFLGEHGVSLHFKATETGDVHLVLTVDDPAFGLHPGGGAAIMPRAMLEADPGLLLRSIDTVWNAILQK